jgi:hypothetical protein
MHFRMETHNTTARLLTAACAAASFRAAPGKSSFAVINHVLV